MQLLDPFTLPLRGRLLLEASAGAGKTWTLGLLVLRLLVEERFELGQILALTYTRAATAELRLRIRTLLRCALNYLDGRQVEEQAAVAPVLAKQPFGEARRIVEHCLANMDEAPIHTIHGFCQRIIQDHAFAAGFPYALRLLENEQELRLRIMEDFWRRSFYADTDGLSRLAAQLWTDPQGLVKVLHPSLQTFEADIFPQADAEEIKRLRAEAGSSFQELKRAWRDHRASLALLLSEAPCLLRNENAYREDRIALAFAAMDKAVAAPYFPWFLPPEAELLTASFMNTKLRKKNKHCPQPQAPAHHFFTDFDAFWKLRQRLVFLWRMQLMQQARLFMLQELSRQKAAEQTVSYDDLLGLVDQALGDPDHGKLFARRIGERYPVMLIDEFQDTDPLQYRIFSRIWAQENKSCVLIGDPKQAIYSFRGADLFAYMRAREEIPTQHRHTMSCNYRSSSDMVRALNILFAKHPQPFVFPAIEFYPVQAQGERKDGALVRKGRRLQPLQVLLLQEDEASGKELSKEAAQQRAALLCATQIQALLAEAEAGQVLLEDRALHGGDIAILVRSHQEAARMQTSLGALGLHSVYASQSSVFATPEARDLALVLSAVLHPGERGASLRCLATSLFGRNASDLHSLEQDQGRWEAQAQALVEYQGVWLRQGVFALIQAIFAAEAVTARLSALPQGGRQLTNLLHLAELLQASEAENPGMDRLLRWLQHRIEAASQADERDSPETSLLRLESDASSIRILTVHKAKGLEFPVVFLPFLWRNRDALSSDSPLVFHDRASGALCIDFDASRQENRRLAEEETLAEEMRLLYVALTRASYASFLCWGLVKEMERTAFGRLVHGDQRLDSMEMLRSDLLQPPELASLLSLTSPVIEIKLLPLCSSLPLALEVKQFPGRLPPAAIIHSYTRLSAGQESVSEIDEEGLEPLVFPALAEDYENIFTFPRGLETGLCLHAILQGLDFTRSMIEQQEFVRLSLEQAGFSPQWLPAVLRWLEAILAAPLPGARPLAGLPASERLHEMNFLFPLFQAHIPSLNALLTRFGFDPIPASPTPLHGFMKGFIDLVFRHQNRYFLVDYKSNYLGAACADYHPKALEASMRRHHYPLQYLLYTVALHRYLQARLAAYSYERHFGGVYYLFLRGMDAACPMGAGILRTRPEESLISELDAMFRDEGYER